MGPFQPSTSYSDLPEGFSDVVRAAAFPNARLRFWNEDWAKRVGLGTLSVEDKTRYFARFESLPRAQANPLAMRYHGHQFRRYNPDLGDGRGFLFAQCRDLANGRLLDFGTKGSGQTPYSRAGDGRLTLKGAVREALATEMLEALGVSTSKTFCFFETGESLERHDEPSPTRGAVLTRLSHGHIRYGTFQRLAALREQDLMRELVSYSLKEYFDGPKPSSRELASDLSGAAVFFMFEEVVARAAVLAASWMMAGFVHGVLNTDNMNITGESFDYGPWRFLPFYDPSFTAAYFDHEGLYSYGRQPEAVYWNLDQLAQALHILAPSGQEGVWRERFVLALRAYPALFQDRLLEKFTERLGVVPSELRDGERGPVSVEDLFVAAMNAMGESKVSFERFFYDWYGGTPRGENRYETPAGLALKEHLERGFAAGGLIVPERTAAILKDEYYGQGFPESMLIDEVEEIWSAIDRHDDWSKFESKVERLRARGRLHDSTSEHLVSER